MARKRRETAPEPRRARPVIFLCERHRRAMEQAYYLDRVDEAGPDYRRGERIATSPVCGLVPRNDGEAGGRETGGLRWGTCWGCMAPALGAAYAFEPRRARRREAGAGGGERARASGR